MMENCSNKYLHKKFKKQSSCCESSSTTNKNNINNNNNYNISNGCRDGVVNQISDVSQKDVVRIINNNVKETNEKSSISVSVQEISEQVVSKFLQNDDVIITSRKNNNNEAIVNFDNSFNNGFDQAEQEQVQEKKIDYISHNQQQQQQQHQQQQQQLFEEESSQSTASDNNNKEKNSSNHTSGGKYVCSYCNLACSKPSVLQKHIRAHTNERPYPCLSCGFSFKTRSNLYKHCRSRTHANRVMGGNRNVQESNEPILVGLVDGGNNGKENATDPTTYNHTNNTQEEEENAITIRQNKPYKPRFHTNKVIYENSSREESNSRIINKHNNSSSSDYLSLHINEVINKNNAIINNSNDSLLLRKRSVDQTTTINTNSSNSNSNSNSIESWINSNNNNNNLNLNNVSEEPLNLSNKNRKRCVSELATEQQQQQQQPPVVPKSLIKELLLKNLYADTNMQCPHCKMIFQTVTELELHKLRNCKGFTKSGVEYNRSNSVNVASILTHNKNAFDSFSRFSSSSPYVLKSPGPFLGKTRLVEKSFSFDDNLPNVHFDADVSPPSSSIRKYSLSPLVTVQQGEKERKHNVKMFGGKMKITQRSGEKSTTHQEEEDERSHEKDYASGNVKENRVVKSSLQSGGTVLQNKPIYNRMEELSRRSSPEVIRVYDSSCISPPTIDLTTNLIDSKNKINLFEERNVSSDDKYENIVDFSQKAAKLLVPNLKQPNLGIMNLINNNNNNNNVSDKKERVFHPIEQPPAPVTNMYNPVNLLVNGKVVRYVPGIPGPVVAEPPVKTIPKVIVKSFPKCKTETKERINSQSLSPLKNRDFQEKRPVDGSKMEKLEIKVTEIKLVEQKISPNKQQFNLTSTSLDNQQPQRKFTRPNTLALKPSISTLKQNHGLTPTMFNQILISPETPRVAKKYIQHFLNGNYFTYLGLKSSTKPTYCTLNKTQPFYVPHFNKLSMYSEWRQQESKTEEFYVSAYDSRQKENKYTIAGKATADLIVHSSYKSEVVKKELDEQSKSNSSLMGGYESTEEYTYIRGRGRGRYVCDQCGIRCKKPSMLKKHIRTHTNDRPYTCSHCNFSFKTKGNLTKHMKSKSHTKNYAASSSSSSSSCSNQQSGTQSSDTDTDDSGMDSSDESTRQQEHEAAYGLLSLSQNPQKNSATSPLQTFSPKIGSESGSVSVLERSNSFMNAELVTHVNNTNYAKNKILNHHQSPLSPIKMTANATASTSFELESSKEMENVIQFLGKTNTQRPLTYPYLTFSPSKSEKMEKNHVVSRNLMPELNKAQELTSSKLEYKKVAITISYDPKYLQKDVVTSTETSFISKQVFESIIPMETVDNNVPNDLRKRKLNEYEMEIQKPTKTQKNELEVMDLSCNSSDRTTSPFCYENGVAEFSNSSNYTLQVMNLSKNRELSRSPQNDVDSNLEPPLQRIQARIVEPYTNDYDNSAMQTLADVATKQVKLERNSMAKNVASAFLKLATKNEFQTSEIGNYGTTNSEVNDLMVKSEENKSCSICLKNFNKPSQLRLHMNIHYLERPFRCDSCSVSFRTKGHLQKHERSASHHNKLSSSPTLSSSEPRPFKCSDCNIAFRIHGHLAKHLRSKMHIMKLECLAKIPFGLYAELERANSLLTEINTTDGDQCLESLKALAQKVFINDPKKLNHFQVSNSPIMDR